MIRHNAKIGFWWFYFAFSSPFATFAYREDRMRFGKTKLKTAFSFGFALTFHYLCIKIR